MGWDTEGYLSFVSVVLYLLRGTLGTPGRLWLQLAAIYVGWGLSVVCICRFVSVVRDSWDTREGLLGYSGVWGSSWPVYTWGGVYLSFVSVVLYLL